MNAHLTSPPIASGQPNEKPRPRIREHPGSIGLATTSNAKRTGRPRSREPDQAGRRQVFWLPGLTSAAPSHPASTAGQWHLAAVVTGNSGASAADSHGLPFCPNPWDTCNAIYHISHTAGVNIKSPSRTFFEHPLTTSIITWRTNECCRHVPKLPPAGASAQPKPLLRPCADVTRSGRSRGRPRQSTRCYVIDCCVRQAVAPDARQPGAARFIGGAP